LLQQNAKNTGKKQKNDASLKIFNMFEHAKTSAKTEV